MDDIELFNRTDNEKLMARIHQVAQRIQDEELQPEDSFNLLTEEFKLTWNQNNEVQWTVNAILKKISEIINNGEEDINVDSWKEIRYKLMEDYNCEEESEDVLDNISDRQEDQDTN